MLFPKKFPFPKKSLVIFLAAFVFITAGIICLPNGARAAVSGTSTPQTTPFPQNKVKESYIFAPLRINLQRDATDTLYLIDVKIATVSNATPTALTSSSFNWIAVASSSDAQFDGGDTMLATTTVNIGATTTLNLPPSINASGTFFIVLNTTSSTSTFTDNGYPDTPGTIAQEFTAQILQIKTLLNGATTTLDTAPITTTTQPFVADTHSQVPTVSSLGAVYQPDTYYLQELSGQTLGEQGTTTVYATQTTTTPLAQVPLSEDGHPLGLIPLGSQYHSSVWLDLVDSLGHSTSARVQYTLPSLPAVTSISAFTDRIIFQTNKQLKGDQATYCPNYSISGSALSCDSPGSPFIDFFGDRVVIQNLDLSLGSQISFSVSGIQDGQVDQFPFAYSTTTLTVQQAVIPTISSITPSSATTGAQVVITGTNFGSATGTLLFSSGFNPATGPLAPIEASTTAWSSTSITATVPAGAKSGPLQIVASNGIMSDVMTSSFFDVLSDAYFKVVNSTSTNPVTTSTDVRIFIGSPNGENLYYDGDSHGTTFNPSTYVYTVPNISSMGFVWAFDSSGTYLSAPGEELLPNTSSTNPQILTFQGTTTRKISGTITLGTTCTSQGQNKLVAAMAMPEGVGFEMGPGGAQPSFFITGTNCTTSYNLALPSSTATSTFRIETHLPPTATSTLLMDPPGQLVTISAAKPTSTLNFIFTQADRKIYGRVVGENGAALSAQEYQGIWVFAYQPKAGGKSAITRTDSNGYFSLYVTQGVYKIGVGGPMVPFPVEKDITVDASSQFATNTTSTSIIIKLSPPTSYIEGYVKDESGNGVSDVDIFSWCEGGPGGGHAFTDSQGYYKMYVSPCSNYHVGGFARAYGDLTEQTGISVTTSNNPIVNFNLSNADFVTVSGTVSKNGSPLSNTDVWITQGQFGEGQGWSRSDSTGAYAIKLRKGLSNLWLHAASPAKGEIYLGQLNGGSALSTSTTVAVSVNTAVIEIHLKPGNTFNDVFLSANSSIGHGSTDLRVSTSTNYDVYKIEVPYSGSTSYTIDGGIPGFGPIPATIASISTSTTVTIDLSGISFYTVSGTVSCSDGASSTDAFVWAGGPQGGGGTRVTSDGTFSMQLRQGTYDIGVGKSGYTGSILKNQNIATTTSGLSLTLTKNTSTISGRVLYGSTPISNAKVWADNGAGGWSGTISEADGSFSLSVSAGEWKVSAVAEGYRLTTPLIITAPASGITLSLSQVNFNPERKQQSIKPVEGGVIQTSDTRVEVPAGALGSDSTEAAIKIQNTMEVPEAKGAKIISSKAREITATYSTGNNQGQTISILNKSATIETIMTKSELVAAGISSITGVQKMKLAYYDGTASNWVELPTTIILTPANATWDSLTSIALKATTQHFSEVAPESPDLGAPSTPTGLTATAGDSQVSLSWSAVSGASKYDIYRKSGSQYLYLTQTVNTAYTDTGLTNGTTYYYKVSALNDADQESAATDEVSATPVAPPSSGGAVSVFGLGDTTPPSISNIKVVVADTSSTISWQTSEPSLSWLLYGASSNYGLESKGTSYLTSHSVTLSGLTPETTYHYQVKSEDLAGNIAAYTDETFTTLALGQPPEEVKPLEKKVPTQEVTLPKITFEKPISEMTVEEIKAKIEEITAAIKTLQTLLAQTEVQAAIERIPAGFTFKKNLKFGDVSDDVKYLQIVLNADSDTRLATSGVGSPGQETKYFGILTKRAVIKFQNKYASKILSPWGLSEGTGFVGKTTRVKLNELLK